MMTVHFGRNVYLCARMDLKRRIISVLLLAVFLPAFFASSLHRHDHSLEETPACVDCHHHSGHLAADTIGIDDCVLCHFLGLPFIAALALTVLTGASRVGTLFGFRPQRVGAVSLRHNRSRAPPFLVLSA